MSKIFGIGFHKTGTTSLEKCLLDLGYRPQAAWGESNHLNKNWFNKDYDPIINFAKRFKSLSDGPWNFGDFYKVLDKHFPDSKFILTVRDSDSWFNSLRKWCTPRYGIKSSIKCLPDGPAFHKAIFGMTEDSLEDHETRYKSVYEQRNQDIVDHFKDTNKLLVVDWNQHGWKELCEFLEIPTVKRAFPHMNKGKINHIKQN